MKKTKRISIIATFLLAFGIFVAGGVSFARSADKVSAATVEDLYVLDEYSVNKVFTIPSAKIKVGEATVDSEYEYLIFPSGKATDQSPVTLDEEGVYELVYTATVDGKKVKATKEFMVAKEIYKVNDEKSSVYFGSDPDLPALKGIVLNLASQDEFTYDEIIDLSDNTAQDSVVKIAIAPTEKGKPDVSEMVIRFTDIYDLENYFEIHVKNVADLAGDWALRQSYITAGAVNQTAGGWENAPSGSKFHVNNEYGFPVTFSMTGVPYNSAIGYDVLTFGYNESAKAVYVDNAIYSGGSLVADLNDSDNFLTIWDGLTTGEVRMSIRGVDYKMETMNVIITEIDGKEPEQVIHTDVAPIINVDIDESKELPYAIVGKEYAVFSAYAFDTHEGEKDAKINVYYNYGTENQTVCSVENGKFIPKREGVYTIVYSAKDGIGQYAEKALNVNAYDVEGLTVSIANATTKGYTGKRIDLFDEIVCENASGSVTYTVTVDGEEILPVAGEYSYLPLKDGTHKVAITVNDYVKEVEYSFDFSALRNYAPQIYDDVMVPRYLIQGEEIVFPALSGYDFSTGSMIEYETEISVKENGGEEVLLQNGKYTPTQIGPMEIVYRLTVDGKTVQKSGITKVVSVEEEGDLHIEKYFQTVSGDAVATASDSYIALTASDDSSVDFINRIQVKDFYMTFVLSEEFNAVGKINVYFTDVVDTTKQLKLTYSKNTDRTASFAVNDGNRMAVEASFANDSENFMITYADGVVYGSSTVYAYVEEYLDGRDFAGFTGDMAYLTIEMEGVTGKSEVHLKNLNRQSLNNANKDRMEPQIILDSIVGDRTVNDVIILNGAVAADVLTNNWTFTMKVTDPNGAFVTAKDGTLLNGADNDPSGVYEIDLTCYGEYYVEYCAADRNGRERLLIFYITVKDQVPPTVELGSAKTTAKVGVRVAVADITASDNISETLSQFICVETPDCECIIVEDGTFFAEKAGEYVVRYMVWDEAGNYTFKSYTVTVK